MKSKKKMKLKKFPIDSVEYDYKDNNDNKNIDINISNIHMLANLLNENKNTSSLTYYEKLELK